MKNRRAALTLYALVCLLRPPSANGTDWPGLGGPNGNFSVDAGLLQPDQPYDLEIVWKKPLGTGYSGIAVRDNLVATLFSDESSDYAIGLDAATGASYGATASDPRIWATTARRAVRCPRR